MYLISWNINGIRAGIKKDLWEKLDQIGADVVCFQETKADETIMNSVLINHPNWDLVFHSCSMKKGYSGVATLIRKTSNIQIIQTQIGLGLDEFDVEGRVITTKLSSGKDIITLINAYYPQGGRDGRVPFKISFYKKMHEFANRLLQSGEKVVLCGDFNTTVSDIDLARPKENRKTTGCLPEERDALNLFLSGGFTDTFRYFYPNLENKYTYWDQITRARDRNVGWRIDYFLVHSSLLVALSNAEILSDVIGSDHCPVGIKLF